MALFEKIKKHLKKAMTEEGDPRKIALGFSVGTFISFTPLLSIHTVLAVAAALIFRLNKVSSIAGAWVNNPYTIPFVYYASYKLGAKILGNHLPPPSFSEFTPQNFGMFVKAYGGPLFLGTTITGLVAAIIAYNLMYYGVVSLRKRKRKKGGSGEGIEN